MIRNRQIRFDQTLADLHMFHRAAKKKFGAMAFDLDAALRKARRRFTRFYAAASHCYQRASERELLRRRIGGFAQLHDHRMHPVFLEPSGYCKLVRECPICDHHKTVYEVCKAEGLM